MSKIAVVGLGKMGTAIVNQLKELAKDSEIYVYDLIEEKENIEGTYRLRDINPDVQEALRALKPDVLINASTFTGNEFYARLAVEYGFNYVDLGQSTWTTIKQKSFEQFAREKGVKLIVEAGMAPGTINVMGAYYADRDYEDVVMYSGGLPLDNRAGGILRYALTWSIKGLIQEYTDATVVKKDGRIEFIQGLADEIEKGLYVKFTSPEIAEVVKKYQKIEERDGAFYITDLESLPTSDGVSLMPFHYDSVRNMGYRTLRYSGHYDVIRKLWRLGLFDSDRFLNLEGRNYSFLDITSMMLDKILPKTKEDIAIMKVVAGKGNNQEEMHAVVLSDDRYTAMQKMTGYSTVLSALAIVGQYDIFRKDEPGVDPPYRYFDPEKYLEILFKIIPLSEWVK